MSFLIYWGPGWPGEDFLEVWLGARRALELVAAEEDLAARSEGLLEARALLRRARNAREAFVEQASGWLEIETGSGDPASRLPAIDRLLDEAHTLYDAQHGPLLRELEALWRDIEQHGADRAPREVLAVCRWFSDSRLERFLERYVAMLQEAAGSTDLLDLDGLRAVTSLDAWADAIAAAPDYLNGSASREILLMRYARRWHDPRRADEAMPPGPVFHQGPGGGSPLSGWRAELELEAMLLDAGSAFPGAPGTRSLYRSLTVEGTCSWQLESVLDDPAPPEDATRSWVVEQVFYDADGQQRGERRRRIVQRGKRFYDEDVRKVLTLDLSLHGEFEQAFWTPEKMPTLPRGIPVRLDDVLAFREQLMVKGWRCLEQRDGLQSTLYSPELGLVRYEDPQRITRELVYVEPFAPSVRGEGR